MIFSKLRFFTASKLHELLPHVAENHSERVIWFLLQEINNEAKMKIFHERKGGKIVYCDMQINKANPESETRPKVGPQLRQPFKNSTAAAVIFHALFAGKYDNFAH